MCGKIRFLTPLWSDFELQFIVNVWCAVWDVRLTCRFIFKGRLKEKCTYNFCMRNSNFWRMCFCIDEVLCTSNTTEIPLIFLWSSEPQEQSFPWVMDKARQAKLASQISKLKTTRLLWMEMDERNELQHEVWNMRHTAVTFWKWHSMSGTDSTRVTTKQQDTVQLRAGFLKTCFKHRPM
jgi:hypothetical protein